MSTKQWGTDPININGQSFKKDDNGTWFQAVGMGWNSIDDPTLIATLELIYDLDQQLKPFNESASNFFTENNS